MQAEQLRVIDASGHVVGRLSSVVAKLLLEGERIVVINSEKALVSGERLSVFDSYKEKLNLKTLYNPRKTPRHPRRPDTMLRKIVRGMLPYRKQRGRSAYKRLRVYVGVPARLQKSMPEKVETALKRTAKTRYVSLGDIAMQLGWRS